jgi:hypothetical protein
MQSNDGTMSSVVASCAPKGVMSMTAFYGKSYTIKLLSGSDGIYSKANGALN